MNGGMIPNPIPDGKELQVLVNRLRKKMAGKIWKLGIDCKENPDHLTPVLFADDKEEAQASPEHTAFLALAVLSSSVDYDKQSDVGRCLHRIGKLLLKIWDDQEKERAIFLN